MSGSNRESFITNVGQLIDEMFCLLVLWDIIAKMVLSSVHVGRRDNSQISQSVNQKYGWR